MKQTVLVLGMILLIGVVSSYYPGETISVNNTLGSTDLQYMVINNDTNIDLIFDITISVINITLPASLSPDTFDIILIHNTTQQVIEIQPVSSENSGDSSGSYYCGKPKEKIVNNTIYIKENVAVECDNNISSVPLVENETFSFKGLWIVIIIVGICFLILLVTWFFNKREKDEYVEPQKYETESNN